ncbi:MAG: DUF2249 domain-containing protein [Pannonibacter sp.]|jgi:uncharacterized protein (DUF2249 family)
MTHATVQDLKPVVTVDLRSLPRPQRHTLVFRQYDALGPGECFELINDHDPLGLLHQFQQTLPGQFSWTYRVPGPIDWHVIVGKEGQPEVVRKDDCCGGGCGG